MRIILKSILLSLLSVLLLSACSQSIQEKADAKKDGSIEDIKETKEDKPVSNGKESVDVEPLPTTYEELANQPLGKYSTLSVVSNDKKILEVFKDLPDISEKPSEKELDLFYRQLLKKVQKDFEGPERAIRELRFQSIGNPNTDDSRFQFKENLNVEIILDASGSMGQKINGRAKMESAKDSIVKFVNDLPKDARVGLRVYGHKGSGADSDKKLSCDSSEMVYSISNYNKTKFQSALNKFSPKGWTPIGLALKEAKNDLARYNGENNTNIVYLVSDGIDTCDDQPIEEAKNLFNSNISPIINVIGFDVDSEGQNQLKQVADVTKGLYATVNNESELQKELEKLNQITEDWKKWKEQGQQSIENKKIDNGLDIFVYITNEEWKASDERVKIELILYTLFNDKRFSRESFDYLVDENNNYHKWIMDEIDQFEAEMKTLSEKNYTDALKELEAKYEENVQ